MVTEEIINVHVQNIVVKVGKPGARIALAVARVVVELRPDPGIVPVVGLSQSLSRRIVAKLVLMKGRSMETVVIVWTGRMGHVVSVSFARVFSSV